MFRDKNATICDFSDCDTLLVILIGTAICFMGSFSSYYDQFYRISQLPPDRTELTPLKDIFFQNDESLFLLNLSLESIFAVTIDNFLNSMTITQQSGRFLVNYTRRDFLDFALNSGNVSFSVVSPVFGSSDLDIRYLNTSLYRQPVETERISILFPGSTLVSDRGSLILMSSFCLDGATLHSFFMPHVAITGETFLFDNGRLFKHVPHFSTAMTHYIESQGDRFDTVTGPVHLVAEPMDEGVNPFAIYSSVLNPIAEILKSEANPTIFLLTNNATTKFQEYANIFKNVARISPDESHCFGEAILHVGGNPKSSAFRERFVRNATTEKIVFLLDGDTNIVNPEILAGEPLFLNENATIDEIAEQIAGARGIAATSQEALGYMFLLPRNGSVFLIGTEEEQEESEWISDMANALDLSFTVLEGRTDDDGITIVIEP
jgi:hypothetical protein